MLKKKPQLIETLTPSSVNPFEAIEYINSYINNHSCENMSVDISFLNIIDACHISTICSTHHYVKYPQGKIWWKVSSKSIKDFNKDLDLGNCEYVL